MHLGSLGCSGVVNIKVLPLHPPNCKLLSFFLSFFLKKKFKYIIIFKPVIPSSNFFFSSFSILLFFFHYIYTKIHTNICVHIDHLPPPCPSVRHAICYSLFSSLLSPPLLFSLILSSLVSSSLRSVSLRCKKTTPTGTHETPVDK